MVAHHDQLAEETTSPSAGFDCHSGLGLDSEASSCNGLCACVTSSGAIHIAVTTLIDAAHYRFAEPQLQRLGGTGPARQDVAARSNRAGSHNRTHRLSGATAGGLRPAFWFIPAVVPPQTQSQTRELLSQN